ncbi:MAG: DUF120 domain-containing protein, partial [Gammaproteobacteria bacterium]
MNSGKQKSLSLRGTVRTGRGRGAGFTQLPWARDRFIETCGIDPYPGTLNLAVARPANRRTWAAMREMPGTHMNPPSDDDCDALLYPVSLGDHRAPRRLTATVVVPGVADYPRDQIEIVAAVNLRTHFDLSDGASLRIALARPRQVAAAIFDVDGTLLNSLDGYRLAATRATAGYGYTVTEAHVRQALNTNQPFWDFVIPPGEPRDEQRIADLRAATMRHFPDALAEVVSVIPGAGEALEQLKSAGISLALFTGSGGESFAPLRDAGLLDLFEVIVTGRDIERRKPDPQGIRRC